MRGAIIKRKTGYSIVYELRQKWDEKKDCFARRQKWEKVPHPDTRKHAEQLLADRLSQLNRGDYLEPTGITFAAFARKWIDQYARPQVRSSTLVLYEGYLKNHFIPVFGSMELDKISVENVQIFKSEKMASGLSPQTAKHLLRVLRQMFTHAIDWSYIRENPAKKVRNPKIPKFEMDFLSADEARVFLDHVDTRWYAFFLTAITTGLRVGELLAMRWRHLDWNGGTYHVKETCLRARGGYSASITEPKTESSIASVNITPLCLEALRGHRRSQAERRLSLGSDYVENDLIFDTDNGGMLDSCNIVKRVFNPALNAAGLRRIRFHDLRHTCASLLIAQGENPKYIQKQLRHASVEMTFDRYGHLLPDTNREASIRLDETLFGKQKELLSAV